MNEFWELDLAVAELISKPIGSTITFLTRRNDTRNKVQIQGEFQAKSCKVTVSDPIPSLEHKPGTRIFTITKSI